MKPRSTATATAPRPARRRRGTAGFTLLEVLVAVTIFSLSAIVLMSSFRVATRAFRQGRQSTVLMQTLRFTVEQISRDLRAVYYETDYNRRFQQLEFEMAQKEFQVIEELKNERENRRDDNFIPGYVGLKLDLQFLGEGGEEKGTLEFAHFLSSDGTYEGATWGAERVRYFLAGPDNTNLYRQRSPVMRVVKINPNLEEEIEQTLDDRSYANEDRARRAKDGNDPLAKMGDLRMAGARGKLPEQYHAGLGVNYLIEEEPVGSAPELIAENVVTFDLAFGHFEDDWKETNRWDSDEKEIRTPPFNVLPEDPMFLQKLAAYQKRATDYLPAYVKMTLGIRIPSGKKNEDAKSQKVKTVESIIWMPSSQEVFIPADQQYFESFMQDGQF